MMSTSLGWANASGLGGRVGVLRYLYGNGAAVVRLDGEASTKVVPLRRLVACSDERPLPDR
jgi:hypothetical protein